MGVTAKFQSFGPFFLSGALVTAPHIYHYAAGTSSDKNAYVDRAKGSTVAQPLVGDSNGIASAYFDGLYKIVVMNATETVTLYTWDNYEIIGDIEYQGQIQFPSTQNPSSDVNALDDYEEGLWTPSVGGNATYSAQLGRYTKIGNQITVSCYLIINAIGTGSASLISGLPFAVEPYGNYTGVVNFSSGAISPIYVVASADASGYAVALYGLTSAATGASVLSLMGNGTLISFSLTYRTN